MRKTVCPAVTTPLFEGEQHGFCSNFLGPGTSIVERLRRGDKPVDGADAVAQQHDIAYHNIKEAKNNNSITKQQANDMVREADNKFIEGINNISGKQSRFGNINALASKQIIKGKKILEDKGVIDPQKFVGEGVKAKPCNKCTRCKDGRKCKRQCPGYALRQKAKRIGRGMSKKNPSTANYRIQPVDSPREPQLKHSKY